MIELKAVTKEYNGKHVVGPVSEKLPAQGITSIVGPNGAGKSTLLTIIGRLLDPSSGSAEVDGMNVQTSNSKELAKSLAILRQENHFTARLTVRELVSIGRFPHSQGRLNAEDVRHVDNALEFLGLTNLADRYLDQLSGGQRQRAYVAMVIAQDTKYLLLDEPLNNLDIQHSVLMMKHLRRVCDELGKSIVLIIHDINFAAAYSDYIIAAKNGEVVAQGTPEQLMIPETLTAVFDTDITVHEVAGRKIAVYY